MNRELVALTISLLQEAGKLGPGHGASGANLLFSCPFVANHGGKVEQKTPSFGIHRDQGLWHCFGCKQGSKEIYNLYAQLMDVTREDAERQIGKPENILQSLEMSLAGLKTEGHEAWCKTAWPETVPLDSVPEAQAYVDGRGVPRWLQARAQMTFYPGKFMPPTVDNKGFVPGRRIILPVYWGGRRVGYSSRALAKDVDMKYYRPIERIGGTVYNPMEYTPQDTSEIWVVEGEFSLYTSVVEGLPTVSTWGSFLSLEQATFLAQFSKVRMMYDPDNAGRQGMAPAVANYAAFMSVMLPVHLPPGMDPGDMPKGFGQVIREAVAKADAQREHLPFEELQRRLLDTVQL